MSKTVEEVYELIEKAGLDEASNTKLEDKVTRAEQGQLGFIEHRMARTQMPEAEIRRTAGNVNDLVEQGYNGDYQQALSFLGNMKDTNIGNCDFNELMESGAAAKLKMLEETNPEAYAKIASTEYESIEDLNADLDDAMTPEAPVYEEQDVMIASSSENTGEQAPVEAPPIDVDPKEEPLENIPHKPPVCFPDGKGGGFEETLGDIGQIFDETEDLIKSALDLLADFKGDVGELGGDVIALGEKGLSLFENVCDKLGIDIPDITNFDETGTMYAKNGEEAKISPPQQGYDAPTMT